VSPCHRAVCGLVLLPVLVLLGPAAAALEGFDPHGSGPGYPACANGRTTEPPSLPAHRIARGAIHIDGCLTEADWIAAPAATGFTQFEPDRRGEPCTETVFKVLYDEDAIYFGVACYRKSGEAVTSCLSRRDNILSSDLLRIYISPYHDMVTGYHFRINPSGVMEDYYNYGDLYHDVSWDTVWEADTQIDSEGWYAELRIPFSSIRYRPGESMTWGCNVFQHVYDRAQRTAWSNWDRDQNGFMSRSGTITGLSGIRAARQLEVTPYIVSGVTDPSDPGRHGFHDEEWDDAGNFGADLKYGITPDLTLNATFQPDFGQVEADPALLNLSPYETYYDEKRPFFIEGAQFFYAPDNVVFYSRRIGTGSPNSRIRFAGKLTGKMAGDVSTAVMVAATDETADGMMHNALRNGRNKAVYTIGRFGKQFGGGMHSFNLMQTAVVRDGDSFAGPTRNGYVTGADFELNFKDRMYQATGSFVGSVIDELADPTSPDRDPDPVYGTGTRFEIEKMSGDWRFALTTRHESEGLDINDLGYINDADHYAVQGWVTRVFNADDAGRSWWTDHAWHLRYYRSWIYADRAFADPDDPARALWSYDRGHDLRQNWHFDGYLNTRGCWGFSGSIDYQPVQTDLYVTRRTPDGRERGPLMSVPAAYQAVVGFNTDTRKSATLASNIAWNEDTEGSHGIRCELGLNWVPSGRLTQGATLSMSDNHYDAQWLGNFANPAGGIGGASYVFGELDQQTWDLTLRSSYLFSRHASLELYLQPFLTVGGYTNPRELVRPDSYDLRPYDYDAAGRDFAFGAVNLNMVYRWEYRPGSTLYVVWTHTREDFDQRAGHSGTDDFRNDFHSAPLLENEAENRFMVKVSYWIPV